MWWNTISCAWYTPDSENQSAQTRVSFVWLTKFATAANTSKDKSYTSKIFKWCQWTFLTRQSFRRGGKQSHIHYIFSWYVSGWRPCSRTCGKGVQTRQVVCRQEVTRGKYKTISDSKCSGAKPTDSKTQDCNKIDCPAEYIPGDWSEVTTS